MLARQELGSPWRTVRIRLNGLGRIVEEISQKKRSTDLMTVYTNIYRMAHEKPARRLVDQRGRSLGLCTGN